MLFKDLETDRLLLKNISREDNTFILSQFSDKDVNKYLYDAEPMMDITEADELIDFYIHSELKGQHRWILIRKYDGAKIGTCGFHCLDILHKKIDIGYDLKKEFWGNGYMTEALNTAIDFILQNYDIHQIDAHIYYKNEESILLAQKLGFSFYNETELCVFRDQSYLHHIYTRKKS